MLRLGRTPPIRPPQSSHFGKHFYSLPRISRPAPPREQRQPPYAPVQQGHLPVNLPRRPIPAKLALPLPASLLTGVAFLPPSATAQTSPASGSNQATSASSQNRWLHVRVSNPGTKDETVRVNVPLELAEKVLPTINKDRLHGGKVRFDDIDCHGIELRALADAVRSSKDG